MDNQVANKSIEVFGCINKVYGVEFQSGDMKIYGCPSDNHVSIFGCPATFFVVPGARARTTKILNTAQNPYPCLGYVISAKKST